MKNQKSSFTPEDSFLVNQAKQGDVSAFEKLFRRYERKIYNFAYLMVGDEADAADLSEEIFVRIYTSLSKLRSVETFPSWIHKIALNVCNDFFRKSRRNRIQSLDQVGEEGKEGIPDQIPDPEKIIETKEIQSYVRRAISTLSEDHWVVVVLHHLEGLGVEEIGRILHCSVGTVKSRLARGRAELKRKLEPYLKK